MLPEDVPIWDKFLDLHSAEFINVYYDVRLGGVIPTTEQATPEMARMFYQVTAKRIDALAEKKDEIWIVEVAAKPGLRAVGQLQTYLALWFEDPKIKKPVVGVLITMAIDSDLQRALEFYGMRVRVLS